MSKADGNPLNVLWTINRSDGEFYAFAFHCPGCQRMHQINRTWEFNEDLIRPTFSPSYLCQIPTGPDQFRCHSYIRDGEIQFLPDSTHSLSGQTVPLIPPLEAE